MSIGIYTHYAHCDQAYFAIRLANYLRNYGESFSLYSDSAPAKLKTVYDNRVCHKKNIKYTDWAKKHSIIVWTHTPKIEQINYAQRYNILTIVAPMWQELNAPFKKTMKVADHVVAFSTECRDLYQNIYKLKNTCLIPFDSGIPATKKEGNINHRKIRVFLPWFDRNARCTQSEFLTHLEYLVRHMEEIHLSVAISSSKFSPSIAKFFRKLGDKTGRVTVHRNIEVDARPRMYADHDLTIFPAECDNYGFCSLMSISCGTPVLTFALAPQNDFLYQEANGVAVKTQVDYDEHGVPHASPDYVRYVSTLQTLIAEPQHIDSMNRKINYNLNSRRKAFELGWQTILRLV